MTDDITLLALSGHIAYNYLVSGSFQLLSRMLFNFLSRYLCTIGFGTYLELGIGIPDFALNSTNATLDPA